jgi:C1q domain
MAYLGSDKISTTSLPTEVNLPKLKPGNYQLTQIQDYSQEALTSILNAVKNTQTFVSIACIKTDIVIAAGDLVTFNSTLYDEHKCWDVSTGKFTSPGDCVLQVNVNILLKATGSVVLSLYVGGTVYAIIYTGSPGASGTLVSSILNFPLSSNDVVFIKASDSCTVSANGKGSQVCMRW